MTGNVGRQETVVIAGGGPAGLTVAYEIASRSDRLRPRVFEASEMLGGLSRTVSHHGNRIDIGGHRFFSKEKRVTDFWEAIMPTQTAPAIDELMLGAKTGTGDATTDPERADRVMLRRRRVSRIYYMRRFFDYPVSLTMKTLRAMGLTRTVKAAAGYLAARLRKLPEESLENFYINRFGRPLYRMFFEDYTEKVWGLPPSQLGADWGAQRVKGLSLTAIARDMVIKSLRLKGRGNVETSLIEEFSYPKLGPGQLWELTAEAAKARGARIETGTAVERVHVGAGRRVEAVTVRRTDGRRERVECNCLVSSMPICDLIAAIEGVYIPAEVRRVASGLPYRDFITVGLLVPRLKIHNSTGVATVGDRIPDTWIYVQERDVKLGRIQVFNNWSPYMVADFERTVWIGLEYFCTEGDTLWEMDDDTFIDLAKRELESIGIIDAADVTDAVRIKVRKAYPSYFGTYHELDKVRRFLDSIPNLYCVGRNGQHRYNNMDHSMLTAMVAADKILAGDTDKAAVWGVNIAGEYHEAPEAGEHANARRHPGRGISV